MSKTMNEQYYQVGDKKFIGAYAGLYESAKTGLYCDFKLPQYHIDRFLNVDVAALKNYTTKNLVQKKIAQLRDENKSIRFHYTGGRDSHTIMLNAQEMGIKFESLFTYTNSVVPNPYVEFEYVGGIEYASSTGMDHIIHRPEISEFEMVWKDKLSFTRIDDFYHGFAPHFSDIYLKNYLDYDIELVGTDKPRFYCKDGSYYWVFTDGSSDWCRNRNHEDFYLGSVYPELAVKQVTLGVEYLKKYYPDIQGWIDYKSVDTESFCKYLGLDDGVDKKINKTNEYYAEFGDLNEKHLRCLRQLIKLGRQDIIYDWIETSKFIDQSIKDAPHGVERQEIHLPEVDQKVKLTTKTVRVAAIFRVSEDRLELIPHKDVQQL